MNIFMTAPHKQQGSMLLEALISILIFSIGILAIIGLQASSIRMSSDAKYRSDASMLANQHLALMWADVTSAVTSANVFDSTEFNTYAGNTGIGLSGGANFDLLQTNITSTLPNANAIVTTTPVIRCDNNPCGPVPIGVLQTTRTDVTITISWQLPGAASGVAPHTYSTSALISAQKQL